MKYDPPAKVKPPAQRSAVEFISTASSSTVSGLLTLFPKCFSSFLHSTCSLSVSRQYLALEGIYLQIRAAFPNYPTLRKHLVECRNTADGALTLSGVPFQGTWAVDDTEIASLDYNSRRIFSWAFPSSLAVTIGILVSFFSSA